MRLDTLTPNDKRLAELLEQYGLGSVGKPKRKILDGITVNEGELHKVTSESDPLNLIGNWLTAQQVNIPTLVQLIRSTVLISSEKNKSIGYGSGVIVNHKGRKYLVTATHVIGEMCFGKDIGLHAYQKVDGVEHSFPLTQTNLVYHSLTATEKGLPKGDIAIFEYNGPINGVEVSELNAKDRVQAFAIGFPGLHSDTWSKDLEPLLSFGFAYTNQKPKVANPYIDHLLAKHPSLSDSRKNERFLNKIIFTGVTTGGNSGGGVFNLSGEIIGVCKGPEGTIGKETGNREFYSIKQLLEEIEKQKAQS